MIDKLHLRHKSQVSDSVINRLRQSDKSISIQGIRDNNYSSSLVIKRWGEHLISIKRSPCLPYLWPTYCEMNPSRYESLNSLMNFLYRLNLNTDEAEIRRIDHCSDMNIHIEEVSNSLIVSRKRMRKEFIEGDILSGMYFGKGKEIISIYNKSLEQRLKKRKQPNIDRNYTRFEVRQKAEKIKYNKLSELSSYLDYDPFKGLKFYNIRPVQDKDLKALPIKERLLHEALKDRGLHSTYKRLNNMGNFNRDYREKLVETSLTNKITKKYHSGLSNFIGK